MNEVYMIVFILGVVLTTQKELKLLFEIDIIS